MNVRGMIAAAAGMLASVATAYADPPDGFTAAQAAQGASVYQTACTICHGATLAGTSDGPALTGAPFAQAWGARPIRELDAFIAANMPPAEMADPLSDADRLAVIAFLLKSNGEAPGAAPLHAGSARAVRP